MALSKKQLSAIQYIVYTDKEDSEIAPEIGVDRSTIWRWRKLDEFNDAIEAECRRKFKKLQTTALNGLETLVARGHFGAIKYIMDGNSYAPTEKHDVLLDATIQVDYGEDAQK